VPEVNPPPMWMVRLNVAMLRRGLRIGSQWLLSVRGRKSGQVRSTPISIATIDGSRYIVAAFSEAAWVRNGFLHQVRGGVRFFGSADPDVVVAGADRYPVFRLDPHQVQVRDGITP
jgi:F420H(2)-dependent quinone reductase